MPLNLVIYFANPSRYHICRRTSRKQRQLSLVPICSNTPSRGLVLKQTKEGSFQHSLSLSLSPSNLLVKPTSKKRETLKVISPPLKKYKTRNESETGKL